MTPSPDGGPAERFTTSAFDYALPDALIAHHPTAQRDASRLLVVHRETGALEHRRFPHILELIAPGDVLVLNETRVIPARLLGTRPGGGAAEVVLLHPDADANTAGAGPDGWGADWHALVRPGARLRPGRMVRVGPDLEVEILEALEDGTRRIRLHTTLPVRQAIERYGRVPLPPYIDRPAEEADVERYQTVYARAEGSVAAPTAGLHFTPALLESLTQRGVHIARVVLHVGVGTFRPVEVEDPAEHAMHSEWYEITEAAAERINAATGRVWAVGTTVVRTLESGAAGERGSGGQAGGNTGRGRVVAGSGWTRMFIRPGYEFRVVDAMITNFHLPRSTLLMLVSAFAGYDTTMAAYADAVRERYRFFSYGDAMAIL